MSKTSKRINPSVIDLFKYQPNRASRNVPEQKRQKQSGPSSNSIKKARYSTSTWTPNDKRSMKVRFDYMLVLKWKYISGAID